MSDAPLHSATEFCEEIDDAACQRALAILLDVGTSIALELKTPSQEVSVGARATAFDRVAEAIRRTIILSRHIAENACASREARRVEARKHVIRKVDDVIDSRTDPETAKALRIELLERVDSLDFELDLASRSPSELILELSRDLGLFNAPGAMQYRRRTPDDIALLCAQAAAPAGSGLPQWIAAVAPQAEKNEAEQNDLTREPPPLSFPRDGRRHL